MRSGHGRAAAVAAAALFLRLGAVRVDG